MEDRLLDPGQDIENPDHHSIFEHSPIPGDPCTDNDDSSQADTRHSHPDNSASKGPLFTDDEDSDFEEPYVAAHESNDSLCNDMPHLFSMMHAHSSSSSIADPPSGPSTPSSSTTAFSTAPPSSATSSTSVLSLAAPSKGKNKLRKSRKATLVPPVVASAFAADSGDDYAQVGGEYTLSFMCALLTLHR
jgi:hypothetical protein